MIKVLETCIEKNEKIKEIEPYLDEYVSIYLDYSVKPKSRNMIGMNYVLDGSLKTFYLEYGGSSAFAMFITEQWDTETEYI